jgi:hypothetical protein
LSGQKVVEGFFAHPGFARLSRQLNSILRLIASSRSAWGVFLCLLDESARQDYTSVAHAEYDPRDSIALERAAHLPETLSERPSKFDVLNVLGSFCALARRDAPRLSLT